MRLLNSIVLIVVLFALRTEGITTYTCTYQIINDSTVYGDDMSDSGQSFPTADGCLNFCCNTPYCVAACFVTSWGGCYLKTADTMNSNPVAIESGTQLLKISGQNTVTSCKRGAAYGGWLSNSDFTTLMSKLPWYYEWTPAPDSVSAKAKGNVEFVPMIWGSGQLSQALSTVPKGAKFLLGFNEPNFGTQSNITPQQAASLWPTLQSYADSNNLKLVSPSLNFCGTDCNVADPISWLTQFFTSCVNCRVDYIAMHSYTCEVEYLRQHVNLYKIFKKPIWVTEFSCGDQGSQSVEVQAAYMVDALAYLDSDPDVFRYSWFSGRTTEVDNVNLLAGNAVLSSLGSIYVNGYTCGASATVSELEAESPNPIISPSAAIIASAFVIFVIVIPITVVVGYICYKKRHNLSEVV